MYLSCTAACNLSGLHITRLSVFTTKKQEGEIIKTLVNLITIARIAGAFTLLLVQPLSGLFFIIYATCGISDFADGYLARKFNVATKLGSLLDSIADFILFSVSLFVLFPVLPWEKWIIPRVIIIALIRLTTLILGFAKYHTFAFLHTYANKATGFILFCFPFLCKFTNLNFAAILICSIATLAAIEELVLTILSKTLDRDAKGILFTSSKNKNRQ